MSETWVRRAYDAAGLTQYPAGTGLRAIQAGLSGSVILCLDVSGSMWSQDGTPSTRLDRAKRGARQFVADARRNGYQVGLIAWNEGVLSETKLGASDDKLEAHLASLMPGGGNDIQPTLHRCWEELSGLAGDRVVAIFGDGDLGPAEPAKLLAGELASDGIRIITKGLGDDSARTLDSISTEMLKTPRAASAETLEADIAAMSAGLKKPGAR